MLNDADGECGTLCTVIFDDPEMAARVSNELPSEAMAAEPLRNLVDDLLETKLINYGYDDLIVGTQKYYDSDKCYTCVL